MTIAFLVFSILIDLGAAVIVIVWGIKQWQNVSSQRLNYSTTQLPPAELARAFAVPADEKWFVGALQIIDGLEAETIVTARNMIGNTNICLNAIGGGEACAELRKRFLRLREAAIAASDQ